MEKKDIWADDYRMLPGQEPGQGKITLRDLLSFLSKGDNKKGTPRGSRSEDYMNLPNTPLQPQSFGLQYRPSSPQSVQAPTPAAPKAASTEDRMTTDSMSFGDAFRTYREMMGPGAVFAWNGKQYTTDLADEVANPRKPRDTMTIGESLVPRKMPADTMTYGVGPVVSHMPIIEQMPDPSSPFMRRYPRRGEHLPALSNPTFIGEHPRPISPSETFDEPYINRFKDTFPEPNWYDILDQIAREKHKRQR